MENNQEKGFKKGRMEDRETGRNENLIEGRNAVLEAFRSKKTIDKLFILDRKSVV